MKFVTKKGAAQIPIVNGSISTSWIPRSFNSLIVEFDEAMSAGKITETILIITIDKENRKTIH